MDKSDAFDIITDPELSSRTTNLKRGFALKLAAQVVHDEWYSFEDPAELAEALKKKSFDPSRRITELLLEYSGSIDAKTLEVLRDVGVGSPQFGVAGIGSPTPTQNGGEVMKRGV